MSCSYFRMETYVYQGEGTCYREEPVTSINQSFVVVFDVAGLDFDQLKLLCGILDITEPPDSLRMIPYTRVIDRTLMGHI